MDNLKKNPMQCIDLMNSARKEKSLTLNFHIYTDIYKIVDKSMQSKIDIIFGAYILLLPRYIII